MLAPRDSETRFENSLESAYSFVHNMCMGAGVTIDRLRAYFDEPVNQYFSVSITNEMKEGDGKPRHILFQRLTGKNIV